MPGWWIYENRPHDRAVVHYWKCRFCRNGEGLHGTSGKCDVWHGSYSTKEEALGFAQTLKRGVVKIGDCCIKYATKEAENSARD